MRRMAAARLEVRRLSASACGPDFSCSFSGSSSAVRDSGPHQSRVPDGPASIRSGASDRRPALASRRRSGIAKPNLLQRIQKDYSLFRNEDAQVTQEPVTARMPHGWADGSSPGSSPVRRPGIGFAVGDDRDRAPEVVDQFRAGTDGGAEARDALIRRPVLMPGLVAGLCRSSLPGLGARPDSTLPEKAYATVSREPGRGGEKVRRCRQTDLKLLNFSIIYIKNTLYR